MTEPRSRVFQQVLAAIALILVPTLWIDRVYGRGFWEIGGARVWILGPLTVAYALGVAWIVWRSRNRPLRVYDLALPILLTAAVGFGSLWLPGVRVSTAVIAIACAGSVGLQIMFFAVPGFRRSKTVLLLLVIALASAAHTAYGIGYLPRDLKSATSNRTIASSLYSILVRSFQRPVPLPLQSGGGVAKLWDDYLLAVGDGTLLRFSDPLDGSALPIRKLRLRVPTNPAEFREAASEYDLRLDWFRVADIETVLAGDTLRLFAAHHHWNEQERCYTMQVSGVELGRAELDSVGPDRPWVTYFETKPCVPLTLPGGKPFFGGLQIGGRMAMIGHDTLLVTVGDHEFDGLTAPISYPQDTSASYGKVFAIDLKSRHAHMISWGHRNPQGLAVTADDVVWSTEHGPRGGDELNRIERGRNYGWPVVTYGVQYSAFAWPFNSRQGAHDGYEAPVYAWVPSIGVSSVVEISDDGFSAWKGDLLAGSLERMALWRMRMDQGRVVVAEPIEVGVQVRDLIEGHDGKLVVWSEAFPGPHIVFLSPNNRQDSGSALFVQCAGCHELGDGRAHRIGPDLSGILGRRIAAGMGYRYSDALRNAGGSWTEERLDAFLRNPDGFAPGTSMRFAGISDAGARRMIIEFLESGRTN